MILKNAKPEEQEVFKSGYDMLTNPAKMGEVFKFMALFPTISKEHYERYPVLGFPGFPKTEKWTEIVTRRKIHNITILFTGVLTIYLTPQASDIFCQDISALQ